MSLESELRNAGWSDELILHFTKPKIKKIKTAVISSSNLTDLSDQIKRWNYPREEVTAIFYSDED
jgi:hypothetical protein